MRYEVLGSREWIRRFAESAGIGRGGEADRSALHIAFELAGCLTWGEAQILAGRLPEPLAGALRAGSYTTAMARFSARAFVSRIAERDGVGEEEARRRISAFLSLLHESLPSRELERLEEELAKWRAELPV